ncbi:MAG: hypothetical protein KA341_04530 [Saprospiraceae bacterium]|nr:hypothetical protein [Saprospiraceae bacterium]
MKIVALILSFIIFHQSLSVCALKLLPSQSSKESLGCSIEHDNNAPVKNCCSKLHKKEGKDQKEKKHKGCCGDNCKCLTCAKIFLHTLEYYSIKESENTIYKENNNMPVLFHSFDFHLSLTNPPQV